MSDLNKWVGIGRLTRDAELKYLNSGTALLSISIAVGKSIPPREGSEKWNNKTNFFDVVMFGKTAERKAEKLTKGRQVGIEGELQQDRWEDDYGNTRSKVKILASSIQILALPKDQQKGAQNENGNVEHYQSVTGEDGFEDDIPF